ncbi:MAG: hypothetical protein R3E98_03040 [Gemmatimonadota bacterium]|nr:hypothetical protein [Gemmatimonadota bacterium]
MRESVTPSSDPGVPEALPRTLVTLRDRLGAGVLDRLWIFPPLIRGRRERGLLVATQFTEGDEDRRLLLTVTYQAERTGKGLTLESQVIEEGVSPDDRVPHVIEGVVSRSQLNLGPPREILLEGDEERYQELLSEYDAQLFEEVAP